MLQAALSYFSSAIGNILRFMAGPGAYPVEAVAPEPRNLTRMEGILRFMAGPGAFPAEVVAPEPSNLTRRTALRS
ncbi:MAG: hypothetical protein KBD25_00030 [Rickettsiaceae bacterium]|nr:hypothetical protein [Rickettsiaceae bacterium]